jgi:DNA-binding CsgD family transcriptional regulator
LRTLLDDAAQAADLRGTLSAAARALGFAGVSWFTHFDSVSGNPRRWWSTHGAAWDERYTASKLLQDDPRRAIPLTLTPALWDCAQRDAMCPFFDAARQCGFGSGVVVRFTDMAQRLAIVSLDCQGRALPAAMIEALAERQGELMLFSMALHANVLAPRLLKPLAAPDKALSPRERQCLALAARGLTSKDIGDKLGVTARTANFHIGNVLRKLGALNRAEAIALAMRAGLLTGS